MMAGLARRLHDKRAMGAMGFAAKVIGIGIGAGLILVYCQFLLDACFRGLH